MNPAPDALVSTLRVRGANSRVSAFKFRQCCPEGLPWALVGRKRGNTAKSAIRPKGKLRIVLLTAGSFAPHLIGRLVFSQPYVNRVPQ